MTIGTTQQSEKRIWLWIKAHRTALIAIICWLVLIGGARQYMTANDLTYVELVTELQDVVSNSWYGPLLYMGVYLLRPAILFPASLLTILGGSVFGVWPGFLYVLIAGTSSAIVPYGIGRWFSDGAPQQRSDETTVQRFMDKLRQNPFQAVLITRLIYLPYDAVSLVAGSLRIPFLIFILATGLGNVAGTLSFVGIGASFEGDLGAGEVKLNPTVLLFSGVILVASIVISRMLNRYQHRDQLAIQEDME